MFDKVRAHEAVKALDWEASYSSPEPRYPTKYKLPKKTKDPFRHLMRDYLTMEQEKDDRQYGSLEDVLARIEAPAQADERWMEILKPIMSFLPFTEYAAQKNMGMLIDTIDNAELRQGYLAQLLDEVRHVHQQQYLVRYFLTTYKDPAGYNALPQLKGSNILWRSARTLFENFINDDPITCSIMTQIIGETAYTNLVFVGMTTNAAAQGDLATPTVFLSVQSDEARHIANGAATLATVMSEPDNLPILQVELDRAFWLGHRFIDIFAGMWGDYQRNTHTPYWELFDRWVYGDWAESFIGKLEPFGLRMPDTLDQARAEVRWDHHTTAMLAWGTWPIQYCRLEGLAESEYEWFERHYPGWTESYSMFWEMYREGADPAAGFLPLAVMAQEGLPPLCRVCHMPCVLPRLDASGGRVVQKDDAHHAFCSVQCEAVYDLTPARYNQHKTWYELFDGMSLSEVIEKCGYLRSDGKTLIGQPHLDEERMWTIDDIRRYDFEIVDPLRGLHGSTEGCELEVTAP